MRAIRAGDCKTADRAADRIWDSIRTSCNRRHDAFDAAEQRRLVKHPFVRLVVATSASATKTASLRKKSRKRA